MNNDFVNNDEEIADYDLDDERRKAYMLLRAGRTMRRLIDSIYCEYGLLLNDESREIYQDLRNNIIYLNNAMNDDCINANDLYLGTFVELDFAKKLDDIDRGDNEYGDKAKDIVSILHLDEQDIIKFTGNVIFDVFSDLQKTLDDAEKIINKNNETKAVYLASMKRNVDESVFAIAINTIVTDLDFSYVELIKLKEMLKEYLQEAVKAFHHDLFRTTVIFSRSIVEALLVYALECIGSDARIDYAAKYKKRSDSYHWKNKAKDITRWDMNDLIDIASQNGIFQTKYLDKYCGNLNYYRNTVHIYKNILFPVTIDFRIANISLTTLSLLNNDLKQWFSDFRENKNESSIISI